MLDLAAVARLAAGVVGEGGVLAVEREGAGWDHVAWRVETADGPWIVRAANAGPPERLAAEARREVAVMGLVRRRLGGWAADAVVLDADLGCIAHRRVPGVPLQELLAAGTVEPDVVAAIAGRLGALVREIGRLDPAEAGGARRGRRRRPRRLAGRGAGVRRGDRRPADAGPPGGGRRAPGRARCRAPVGRRRAGAGAQRPRGRARARRPGSGSITGIIDWSDAAVADPAAEVGRLLRDLGEAHLPAVLDGLGVVGAEREALTARAWWYARLLVLEDLAYAVEHRPDLVAFELASLDRLY